MKTVIAELLIEGFKSEDNPFKLALLPIAKSILQTLVAHLNSADDDGYQIIENHPPYRLKSAAGKILTALLTYSLQQAHHLRAKNIEQLWEKDTKKWFETGFEKGLPSTYMLLGVRLQDFYFLDVEWTVKQVKELHKSEERRWFAFFKGLLSGQLPIDKKQYQLLYPHYKRAIGNKVEIKDGHDNKLFPHLLGFYFLEFEQVENQSLLFLFIEHMPPKTVQQFIFFLSWGNYQSLAASLKEVPLLQKKWKALCLNFGST